MTAREPAECGNCGGADEVAWYSFDLDLPAIRLCGMCALCLTANRPLFEQFGKRRKKRPTRRAAGPGTDQPGDDPGSAS